MNLVSIPRSIASPVKLIPAHLEKNMDAIERAFDFSSKALLNLMMGPSHQLIQRLRALKHYFLIDQGDFFVHFMHTAEEELRKECSVISTGKLEGLLDASITISILGEDSFREKFALHFATIHSNTTFGTSSAIEQWE